MAQAFSKRFYDSKLWKQQRLYALHRDCYQCADCGGQAEEVHHIVELTAANINDYSIALDLNNLVSLCHDCHTKRHADSAAVPDGYRFDESGQLVPGGGSPPSAGPYR